MRQSQKITAHTLKRIEKTLAKMNAPMGAFELFFTFLGLIATEERFQPADIVKALLKNAKFYSNDEAQQSIDEIFSFSNGVVFTLTQLEEGIFTNKDVKALSKNLCKTLLDKLTLKTLREKYAPSVMGSLYESFESKGYDLDNFHSLINSIKQEYGEYERLVDGIADMVSMFYLCNVKEFAKILSEDGETLDGFLEYFTENAIRTYAILDMIRRAEFAQEQSFEEAKRNDPCPCGSGKKYKKCCMGKNKNPLSALAPYKLLYKPRLSLEEVKNYYNCYNKLLTFAYAKYAKINKRPKKDYIFNIMENGTYFCDLDLMRSGEISDIRDYFATHPKIIDEYLGKEQNSLNPLELKTIKNFKNMLYDQFIIMERINNSEVLAWNVQNKKIYLVYGLYDPIAEVVQELPCIASLILLEYEERIVFDGLMGVNRVEIGNNMLLGMIEEYRELRDANGVIMRFGE
ncbi:MAG: SEC-C domain-containing protein [Sulfurimonas sp.]